MICQNGHSHAAVISNEKHEVLFQMGLHAFLDDYYREAVVNFASAYEESMKVLALIHLVSSGVRFPEARSVIADLKTTENSKGAYILAHAIIEGRTPTLMNSNSVKFRNDVVHKGLIPTISQADDYGNRVLEFCLSLQKIIQTRFLELFMNIQHEEREFRLATLPPDAHLCLRTLDTCINFTRVSEKPFQTSLNKCLDHARTTQQHSVFGSYSFIARKP
jgi:hypothetical protein